MGYETRFHLELDGDEESIELFKDSFINNNDNEFYYIVSLLRYTEYEAKWYSHEADIKSISKEYPGIIFRLYGIGENWGDFWLKVFENGNFIKKYDCILHPKVLGNFTSSLLEI